jgi:hypothetical protein
MIQIWLIFWGPFWKVQVQYKEIYATIFFLFIIIFSIPVDIQN